MCQRLDPLYSDPIECHNLVGTRTATGGFPELRVALGVPIIRITVYFSGLYWGPRLFREIASLFLPVRDVKSCGRAIQRACGA